MSFRSTFFNSYHGSHTEERPLRQRVLENYASKVETPPKLSPATISIEAFTDGTTKWLRFANTPYSERQKTGVCYADDYIEKYGDHDKLESIQGLSHTSFWEITSPSTLFIAKEGELPNRALAAFFNGPTFAECGNALLACIYKAIEQMVGTDDFNRIFGGGLSQFLISPILFNKIYTKSKYPKVSLAIRQGSGNPLYFLFDKIKNHAEADVQVGDIVYIEGVSKYDKKHLLGYGRGWNLICIGNNSLGENLYLGFGPISFAQPRTYREIKSILINWYNADQTIDTKELIKKEKAKQFIGTSINSFTKNAKAILAYELADDKVNDDHPIGGIKGIIRFNTTKLELFLKQQIEAWHTQVIDESLFANTRLLASTPIKQVSEISTETKDKTFNDYKTDTDEQKRLLTLAKQFAQEVCRERSVPAGFVMTGMAGIGKTHLAIAIATHVNRFGRRVMLVDESRMKNIFQKMCEKEGGFPSDVKMVAVFQAWLEDADLVIIDDLNSCGIATDFLKYAINYVISHNKAIIITANQPMLSIKSYLPEYIAYNDPYANSFLILQGLQGQSHRKTWWSDTTLFSTSGTADGSQDLLEILANYQAGMPAGIIIQDQETIFDDDVLEVIARRYHALEPGAKIRIMAEPMRNNYIYDYYIHDADNHDVFIIKMTDDREQYNQLFRLVSKIHDLGKKLIIVTSDENKLLVSIYSELNRYLNRDIEKRISDRTKHLLLKKSDRMCLSVRTANRAIIPPGEAIIQIGPIAAPSSKKKKTDRSSNFENLLMSHAQRNKSNNGKTIQIDTDNVETNRISRFNH